METEENRKVGGREGVENQNDDVDMVEEAVTREENKGGKEGEAGSEG